MPALTIDNNNNDKLWIKDLNHLRALRKERQVLCSLSDLIGLVCFMSFSPHIPGKETKTEVQMGKWNSLWQLICKPWTDTEIVLTMAYQSLHTWDILPKNNKDFNPDMVVAAYNPSTWDVEASPATQQFEVRLNWDPVSKLKQNNKQFYSQLNLILQLHWFAYILALAYFKSRMYILFFYTSPKTTRNKKGK